MGGHTPRHFSHATSFSVESLKFPRLGTDCPLASASGLLGRSEVSRAQASGAVGGEMLTVVGTG